MRVTVNLLLGGTLKKIMTSTAHLLHGTEFDIALQNHASNAQPTD